MRRALTLAVPLSLALAACGQTAPLEPRAGHELPKPPVGRDTRLTADELLKVGSQAAPQRSVELRSKSEDRGDDPFDLPPR